MTTAFLQLTHTYLCHLPPRACQTSSWQRADGWQVTSGWGNAARLPSIPDVWWLVFLSHHSYTATAPHRTVNVFASHHIFYIHQIQLRHKMPVTPPTPPAYLLILLLRSLSFRKLAFLGMCPPFPSLLPVSQWGSLFLLVCVVWADGAASPAARYSSAIIHIKSE